MTTPDKRADVEVRMEGVDRWEPGTLRDLSADGHRALIEWKGITAWFERARGRGYPNEWRYLRAR